MDRFRQIKDKIFSSSEGDLRDLQNVIPFINELRLSEDDIAWLKEVKKGSSNTSDEFTAFRLAKLYLRVKRDMKELGPYLLSEVTEKEIDEFFSYIFFKIPVDLLDEELRTKMLQDINLEYYERQELVLIGRYSRSLKAIEKFALLSLFLDIWHKGGSNILFSDLAGIPKKKEENGPTAERRFFNRLNNFGKDV